MTRPRWLNRQVLGGVVTIVAVAAVVWALVARYGKPGMDMDMSAMNNMGDLLQAMNMTPITPVATTKVERGDVEGTITYTGTIQPYTEELVYPRVEGWLVWMPFYAGDHIKQGQLLARLDSTELTSRTREARFGYESAQQQRGEAEAGVRQAEAMKSEAESRARAQSHGVEQSRQEVSAAEAELRLAGSEVTAAVSRQKEAESEREAARRAVAAAEAAVETSKAGLTEMENEVTSAQAELDYWKAEIGRQEALFQQGAVSQDEYQSAKAAYVSAQAMVAQAEAKVRRAQAEIRQAEAMLRQAEAEVGAKEARVGEATAEVTKSEAEVDRAQANIEASRAGQAQAQAELEGTRAQTRSAEAGVRASAAKQQGASSAAEQSKAALTTASIVRGYTEIRARTSGYVTERLISPGVLVGPGMAFLRIARIDKVRLQANVAEKDLAKVRVGNQVRISTMKGAPYTVSGSVSIIFPQLDPKTRTAKVEVVADNAGEHFLPGQYVVMNIVHAKRFGVLTLPASAIVTRAVQGPEKIGKQERTAVWVVRRGAPSAEAAKPAEEAMQHSDMSDSAMSDSGTSASDAAGHAPTAGQAETTERIEYTCTMHPEVRSDKPGKCPKCNMSLVPVKVGGESKEGVAHLVFVTTGVSDAEKTAIISGLSEGDEVVYAGHENLQEGWRVLPSEWGPEGPKSLALPAEAMGGTEHSDSASSPAH